MVRVSGVEWSGVDEMRVRERMGEREDGRCG